MRPRTRALITVTAVVSSLAALPVSPFAAVAAQSLTVEAGGSGPFDSHVGTLAVLNLLVAGVAERLRSAATERLDRAEMAWRESGALVDR